MSELRVGIQGCGTIGRYVLEGLVDGAVSGAVPAVVMGRTDSSRGRERVRELDIPWVTDVDSMIEWAPDVVVEAASHAAVERDGLRILTAGIDLVPLSLGALVDGALLEELCEAARVSDSLLYIPSGGIGGLDALAQARCGDVYSVTMVSRKPPGAWKGIDYVEQLGVNLDALENPLQLYCGPARDCVKKFPQNINIAAALSLAGLGFDETMIEMYADPTVPINRHEITCEAESGRFTVIMENAPVPENPKTTYMACLSGLAALRRLRSNYRVGT